jgi:hypothetical protein
MQTLETQKRKQSSKKCRVHTKCFLTQTRKLVTTNLVKQELAVLVEVEIHSVERVVSATFLKRSLAVHRHLVAVSAVQVVHRVAKTSKQLQTLHLKKLYSGVRQQ